MIIAGSRRSSAQNEARRMHPSAFAFTSIDACAAAYAPTTIADAAEKRHQVFDPELIDKYYGDADDADATAKILSRVIFSFGRNIHASTSPKTVIIACRTAARPEEIYCSLQKTML